jgi:anthranilate phosphoribosyltransferase
LIDNAIKLLTGGGVLSRTGARDTMDAIMSGDASPTQISAVLVALRMRGESPPELAGFAEGMRAHVLPVNATRTDIVDTAGTGGDGADTFNISTTAALVAAAAGAAVAKHGNRAVSSSSGSADVLEALGFDIELPSARVAASIDQLGFGFMFAPLHHPAMKYAAPVRRELGIRTVFNLLGPLTNPAGARRQVIGVYEPELVPLMGAVLGELGVERALVVHGAGGVDELTTLGPNTACLIEGTEVRDVQIDPATLGFETGSLSELRGGTGAQNATRTRSILMGEQGLARDTVVLNAAAALYMAGVTDDLAHGCDAAEGAIADGRANSRLEELIQFSNRTDDNDAARATPDTGASA